MLVNRLHARLLAGSPAGASRLAPASTSQVRLHGRPRLVFNVALEQRAQMPRVGILGLPRLESPTACLLLGARSGVEGGRVLRDDVVRLVGAFDHHDPAYAQEGMPAAIYE